MYVLLITVQYINALVLGLILSSLCCVGTHCERHRMLFTCYKNSNPNSLKIR